MQGLGVVRRCSTLDIIQYEPRNVQHIELVQRATGYERPNVLPLAHCIGGFVEEEVQSEPLLKPGQATGRDC